MHKVISYHPGQTATVILSVFNTDGELADGYGAPQVTKVIFPNGTVASGFPINMTALQTGIYQFKFTLPSGATSFGTYICVVSYGDPDTQLTKNEVVEIVVSAPFGNFSVTPG